MLIILNNMTYYNQHTIIIDTFVTELYKNYTVMRKIFLFLFILPTFVLPWAQDSL